MGIQNGDFTFPKLPCPFCGSTEIKIRKIPLVDRDCEEFEVYNNFKIHSIFVECMRCGARGPTIAFVDNVISAWDNRILQQGELE